MNKIYIETYGCSNNLTESEIMSGLLEKAGFDIVKTPELSDLIIVNTCIVKGPTENKIISRLEHFEDTFPKKKLIIAGCAPEGAYTRFTEAIPTASLLSTHRIKDVARVVQKTFAGQRVEALGETADIKLGLPKIRKNPIVDIVPISTGCNGLCTYCAVRLAKGKLRSYPKDKILREIRESVRIGCKEIWLTAQDTASYGLDKYSESHLPVLLKEIEKIPGNFKVRVGMMNPHHAHPVLSELIEAFNGKKIYKFLHLPIQSGDQAMLHTMNRYYTKTQFEEIVSAFKSAFRVNWWTDVIVGYPEETEEQFMNSVKLIKILKPDYVNVSKFYSRKGTVAANLPQLPSEMIKRRSKIMSDLVNNIALEKNRRWIGWTGDILISEKGKKEGQWIGRNFAYKSILINKSGQLLGQRINVKIRDASPSGLMGWPLKED